MKPERAITNENWASYLFAYEDGMLSECQVIELFQFILDNDKLQALQGSYHRMAQTLVEAGMVGATKEAMRPRKYY